MEERYESELAQSTSVLDDVDRALERLTSGAYDSCEVCGAVIPDAYLAADPTRRVCAEHGTAPGTTTGADSAAAAAADSAAGAGGPAHGVIADEPGRRPSEVLDVPEVPGVPDVAGGAETSGPPDVAGLAAPTGAPESPVAYGAGDPPSF